MTCKLIPTLVAAVAWLTLTATLSSCEDSQEQYTREYTCYLTFNTQFHPASLLTLALGNPGSFVRVDVKNISGAHHLYIYSNNGRDQEEVTITTDKENYLIGNVGANNSVIVGCTTFSGLRAYDSQCPNCLENFTGNSYPLTWASNGQAVECTKCGRRYELNYEGRADEGRQLLQYRVAYNGNMLTVHN